MEEIGVIKNIERISKMDNKKGDWQLLLGKKEEVEVHGLNGKKKLKDKELVVLSEKENVQEEYFVEFLGKDHEVQQNERIEWNNLGNLIQFVGKLFEANLKRSYEEMEVVMSKVWKKRKIGMLMEIHNVEVEGHNETGE